MQLKLKNIQYKALFIEHVEKGALALACLCLVLYIISAVGREKLPPEKEPDQLLAQTNNARNHLERSEPSSALKEVQPPDRIPYSTRVQRDPVLLDNYATRIPFNPPIIESKTPREEPIYFSVKDLRVGTGFAPFATMDPDKAAEMAAPVFRHQERDPKEKEEKVQTLVDTGITRDGVRVGRDTKLVVKYWAMVTGLIPIREQKAEYFKAFETAVNFDPTQDIPHYLGYQVERAEVTSGDLDNLDWKQISADKKFMELWGADYGEPVAADNVTPMFAQPLAPRVGSAWEDYVGHPKIPMEVAMRDGMPGPGGMQGPGGMPGPGGMRGPGGAHSFRGGPRGGHSFPGEAGGEGFEEPVEEEGEGTVTFDRAAPRRERVVQEEDPAERRKRQEIVGSAGQKSIRGVDYLLFRFCDFSVEPGKQYVYRVRLGLRNPNRGLPPKYLKRPELAKAAASITPWSDRSPIATIPYGDKMLAGKVIPPTTSIGEPKALFRIIQVNEELGTEVPLEKEVSRGTLANFQKADFRYKNYAEGIVSEGTADFITNALVLDMRGGQPIFGRREKDITQPGEVLVFTRTGDLIALNEFDDEETWKLHAPRDKEEADPSYGEHNPMFDMSMPMEAAPGPSPRGKKPPKNIRGGPDQHDILRQPPPRPSSKRSSRSK